MVGDVTGMTDQPEREGSQTVVDHYITDCERSPESATAPESIVTKKHNGKVSADEPSEDGEEFTRLLTGSTQQHPHHHHNRQLQQCAVNQYIPDCQRSPEIGDLHSSTDSGDDLTGDKMLGQKRDDWKKTGAVGGVVSSVVKEVDMNMDEMISMLDQEYDDNEENLSVENSELDKTKSNRMSSEKQIHNLKDSIENINNTCKDLSSQLSPENLDLLECIVTEVRSLKQAEEQHEIIKNTLSSKQKKYDFILAKTSLKSLILIILSTYQA
jgi:hypothetical protein